MLCCKLPHCNCLRNGEARSSRRSGTVPFALSKGKVLFSERWAGPTTQTINLTLTTHHQQQRNITRRTEENQNLGKHPCPRHKMWGPQGLFCCHIFGGKSLLKRKRSVTSLQNQIQVVMIRTRWLKKTSLVCWKCCSFQVPCCKEEKHLSQDSRRRWCLTRTSYTDYLLSGEVGTDKIWDEDSFLSQKFTF